MQNDRKVTGVIRVHDRRRLKDRLLLAAVAMRRMQIGNTFERRMPAKEKRQRHEANELADTCEARYSSLHGCLGKISNPLQTGILVSRR